MTTNQEYGSELNAVTAAFRKAREEYGVYYAVETKYGWITAERKPSLRFGKVWECHTSGEKHYG